MKPLLLFFFLLFIGQAAFLQSTWELRKDENQIKVWTQKTPSSKFDTYKASSVFNASIENILALLFDIPNSHEQYDVIRKTFNIKQLGPLKAEYYIDFDFPWPVTDRIVKAISEITIVEDGWVKVLTIDAPFDLDPDGKVVVTSMYSKWDLQKISSNQTKVTLIGHMDPSGSIPGWLANQTVVDSPLEALKRMRDRLPLYEEVDLPLID